MNKKKLYWQLPFLALLIIGTVVIVRAQRSTPYQHDEGFIFGTVYHVTYQSNRNLQKEIEAELHKVDNSLSMFNPSSTISKVNASQKYDVSNDRMFQEVFSLAEKISGETSGAFDITVAPLVNAWGFGFKSRQMPTDRQVDSLRHLVGYKKVRLTSDGSQKVIIKDDQRIMLDCSGIAKGYGSDMVARVLRSHGIENFMVEIGGEVVACGINDKRLPWKIGVTKPTDDSTQVGGELQTVLNVTDMAMATSGNYRNFYYKGGRKYAHTIDPATGRPVQHSILSATVLAKDCATADAYATSFMVMGMEKAGTILKNHPELMAYFIYDDGHGHNAVWFSPSMKGKIIK